MPVAAQDASRLRMVRRVQCRDRLLPGSVFKDATVAAASPKSHEAIQWP